MLTTADRKIGLDFFSAYYTTNSKKDALKQAATFVVVLVQNRVLRCAQPALRRLLRKMSILTQMLHQRNIATAHYCP